MMPYKHITVVMIRSNINLGVPDETDRTLLLRRHQVRV